MILRLSLSVLGVLCVSTFLLYIGKYTALLAILIVGSFVIPMAQYFWYVRDDDSTEQFFGQTQKVEEPPPKKKGWF